MRRRATLTCGRRPRRSASRSRPEPSEQNGGDHPMAEEIKHFIAGKLASGKSGRTAPVFNPATGEAAGQVALANAAEVDEAVRIAREAFPKWAHTPALRRARVLMRFLRLLEENEDRIAQVITREHGKVLSDAKGELARGVEVVEFATGAPQLLKGEVTENVGTRIDSHSLRQPLGVVAGITPFNFPVMVPMWMFPVALACGNCFILKPSERVPSASLILADLLSEAGLPEGVFNIVHGGKDAVDALLHHPDIAGISFVGSTPIARYIYETAATNGKRCQALGGAKNHMIVLPDADIEMAADAAVSAAYGSAGERCMAVSLLVAVGDVADPLIDAIKARIPNVKVGNGMDASSEMGPLITREHRDKVASYLEDGGGDVLVDGRDGCPDDGFFLSPSLIDGPGTAVGPERHTHCS